MSVHPGIFWFSGIGLLSVFVWLVTAVASIYAFVLLVKLAHRGITALDLYIYAKNQEIRTKYESADNKDRY